jgi:hypothetical protein
MARKHAVLCSRPSVTFAVDARSRSGNHVSNRDGGRMSISRPVWRTIFFHSGAVVAASIWLAGCDRSPEPSTSPTPQPSRMVAPSSRVVGSKYRRPDEDRFVVVGQAAPSFGGFFIDPTTGDIVVHVADSSQFGLAVASLRAHLSDENFGFPRRFRSGRILVRKVAYSLSSSCLIGETSRVTVS